MRLFFEEYGGAIFLILFFMAIIGVFISLIPAAAQDMMSESANQES